MVLLEGIDGVLEAVATESCFPVQTLPFPHESTALLTFNQDTTVHQVSYSSKRITAQMLLKATCHLLRTFGLKSPRPTDRESEPMPEEGDVEDRYGLFLRKGNAGSGSPTSLWLENSLEAITQWSPKWEVSCYFGNR